MPLISIRTPAWGVTAELATVGAKYTDFNSHPRVGGDQAADIVSTPVKISIRTPAWGVTVGRRGAGADLHFNSHPRVGGDLSGGTHYGTEKFQFAPPRGG